MGAPPKWQPPAHVPPVTSPPVMSAALSAGASVAQTGVTFFDRGKARTVEYATMQESLDAVRIVIRVLALERTLEDPAPPEPSVATPLTDPARRVRMSCRDERGQSVVIVLERRTATVTLIQADVGVLGEMGLASLVVKQILTELTPESAERRKADAIRGSGASQENR